MDDLEVVGEQWKAFKKRRREVRKRLKIEMEERVREEMQEEIGNLKRVADPYYEVPFSRFGTVGIYPQEADEMRAVLGEEFGRKPRQAVQLTHGKYSSYVRGCRCDECRGAASAYQKDRYARKKEEGK